jgi:hypothetical protein
MQRSLLMLDTPEDLVGGRRFQFALIIRVNPAFRFLSP